MDILLHLDPVVSTSARALRHLYDRIEANVCGLKLLGVYSKTYGSLLSPVLINKLPPDIRLIVSREISETDWTFVALLRIVKTGRCCLRRGHVSCNCRSTTKCYKCRGKHHNSICTAEAPKDPAPKDESLTSPIAPSSQLGTSLKSQDQIQMHLPSLHLAYWPWQTKLCCSKRHR